MSNLDGFKDDFDSWVDKWDKAQEQGIFKDAPKLPSTADQTSNDSFFGFRQDNHTDSISSSDAEYWKAINSVADGEIDMQRIDEASDNDPPNPVRKGTEGPDSALDGNAVGETFNEDDVNKLAEMKIKLHDLHSKVAEMGEKKYEEQIKALIEKIQQLSDKMGRLKNS